MSDQYVKTIFLSRCNQAKDVKIHLSIIFRPTASPTVSMFINANCVDG